MNILIGGHVLGFFAGQLPDLGGHLFLALSQDAEVGDSDLIIRGGPIGNDLLGNYSGEVFEVDLVGGHLRGAGFHSNAVLFRGLAGVLYRG